MSFQLQPSEDVESGLRRLAAEQIETALEEIKNEELDRAVVVHQVRKRCKKLRGLLRLGRSALGKTYATENDAFREAAGELSQARDAKTILDALDQLCDLHQGLIVPDAFAAIRAPLQRRREEIVEEEGDLDLRLAAFGEKMTAALDRVSHWKLKKALPALAAGWRKIYEQGREGYANTVAEPSIENIHEWRKAVKYHWYHVRILQPFWKQTFKLRKKKLKELSDLLGDDHDLANLRDVVEASQESDNRGRDLLFALIDYRRQGLQASAWVLGEELYSMKPGEFTKRLRRRM